MTRERRAGQFIEVRRTRRGAAEVVLSRPERLNALSAAFLEDLTATVCRLSADDGLGCVVVSGSGRAFSSGADIDELARLDHAGAEAFIRCLSGACRALRDCPVPVVASIDGPCLGGALELAASCDMRAASHRSTFAMPEVQLGLPSVIEAALLPRLIGWGRTSELLFTGRTMAADEALAAGLVEAVAEPEDLAGVVGRWVGAVLEAGPLAIRAQKRLMRVWERSAIDAAIEAGVDVFAGTWRHDEAAQRIAARAARRRPSAGQATPSRRHSSMRPRRGSQ